MPLTRVHNKEHCVQLQLFNRCPVPDRWCFIFTLLSRQHNALSCQGLMEVTLTLDANSGTSLLEHYRCYSYSFPLCLQQCVHTGAEAGHSETKVRSTMQKSIQNATLWSMGKSHLKSNKRMIIKTPQRNSRRQNDN